MIVSPHVLCDTNHTGTHTHTMASSAADDSDASSPVVAQTLPHLTQFLDKKALCVFTGTIKCVPEDFVVTEIALNGGVVSLAVPPPLPPPVALAATESARSNGAGDGAGGGAGAQSTPAPAPTPTPAPPPSSADCTPQVKACLALGDARKALQLLGVDITPDVDVRLEHVRTAAASTPVDLIVPAACLESRNTRAALHQAVQLAFPGVTTRVDAGPPPALRVEHDARFDPLRPLLHSTDLVALQRYAVRGPQHEAARRGVSMVNSQLGKDERRKVHQALARSLRGLTSATRPHQEGKPQPRATKRQRRESTAAATVTTAETVIVVRYKPGKPSKRRQKQQKQQKQQTGGQATSYTWFALQKTGIEQQVALGQLSRAIAAELGKRARINPSSFSFAGIKDKVGVRPGAPCHAARDNASHLLTLPHTQTCAGHDATVLRPRCGACSAEGSGCSPAEHFRGCLRDVWCCYSHWRTARQQVKNNRSTLRPHVQTCR